MLLLIISTICFLLAFSGNLSIGPKRDRLSRVRDQYNGGDLW